MKEIKNRRRDDDLNKDVNEPDIEQEPDVDIDSDDELDESSGRGRRF